MKTRKNPIRFIVLSDIESTIISLVANFLVFNPSKRNKNDQVKFVNQLIRKINSKRIVIRKHAKEIINYMVAIRYKEPLKNNNRAILAAKSCLDWAASLESRVMKE